MLGELYFEHMPYFIAEVDGHPPPLCDCLGLEEHQQDSHPQKHQLKTYRLGMMMSMTINLQKGCKLF